MSRAFIGIDPGASGGIAITFPDKTIKFYKMPETEWEIFQLLRYTKEASKIPKEAIIEKVGGFIGKNQPASRAFKFGHSYGGLRMALIALEIPFDEVVPRKWQQAVGVISKSGESKTEHKNRLKAKAQQLFPQEKITLATADAILLAVYCQKTTVQDE